MVAIGECKRTCHLPSPLLQVCAAVPRELVRERVLTREKQSMWHPLNVPTVTNTVAIWPYEEQRCAVIMVTEYSLMSSLIMEPSLRIRKHKAFQYLADRSGMCEPSRAKSSRSECNVRERLPVQKLVLVRAPAPGRWLGATPRRPEVGARTTTRIGTGRLRCAQEHTGLVGIHDRR